jgi:anion exchange protein
MIISVSIGNFVYALTAGQPLVVLGGTGPTLIFEDILFQFCEEQGLPYLQFRFWIGLWVAFFIILLVAFNASVIVRLFTRFTEEIFSALISFIFIYEAFEKIWKIHLVNPYSGYFWYPFWKRDCQCYEFDTPDNFFKYMTNESSALLASNATSLGYYWEYYTDNDFIQSCDNISQLRTWVGPECPWIFKHNVLFFSIILFFGTFAVAFYLKKFKNSPFFPTWVRRIISDFGVLISVVIWVLVNFFVHVEGVANLDVPDILSGSSLFSNDSNGRTSLLINPVENLPAWVPFASIIPALLATILLFMDQQITALIVNRKDNKLQKGPGYHLDMLIVAVLIGVFSVLGLPWVVGATVRSIAHVQSLFLYSPCTAPGERPKFLGVKEQRVTLLCMSILLGISILAHQVLQLIPLPVLYGLFLYMGVTSLYGVQFVERIGIMFMPDKYKPDEEYVRHIPNRRLHLYTIVQIFMLLVLCVFKVVNEISIIFPIMVLLLVAGRWLVGWFFPERDLQILDDPIPESLYCGRPCSPSKMKKKRYRSNKTSGDVEKDVEKGVEEVDSSHNGGINISHEVNRCDLWQHMVHTLDKEPERCRKNLSERFEQEMVKIGDESARELDSVDANNATLTQYKSTEI